MEVDWHKNVPCFNTRNTPGFAWCLTPYLKKKNKKKNIPKQQEKNIVT